MRVHLAITLLLLLVVTSAVSAQDRCLLRTRLVVDTIDARVGIRVSEREQRVVDMPITLALGAAIEPHFSAPSSIAQLFYPFTFHQPRWGVAPLHKPFGAVRVTWDSVGALDSVSVLVRSQDPATDSALVNAIVAADSAGSLTALSRSGSLRVELGSHLLGTPMYPLARFEVKIAVLDQGADVLGLVVPPRLRGREQGGEWDLQFVVDEAGRIELPTVRALTGPENAYFERLVESLQGWRFRHPTAGGCPAKAMTGNRITSPGR